MHTRALSLAIAATASLLILVACTGSDGGSPERADRDSTPATTSLPATEDGERGEAEAPPTPQDANPPTRADGDADETSTAIELGPLEAMPQEPDSGPGEGRGFVAGLDTSFRSVDLADVHFDLFNGSTVSLADAPVDVILALRDLIPPLDASRALLPADVRERVGEVAYIRHENATFLQPANIVLGYVADDGQAYAYSLGILNSHEIVNETLGGRAVVITYCPLCASGVVYDRVVGGEVLTFGNTSALYQNDLVMLNRQTGSYWFQVGGEAVVGPLTGARLPPLPSTLAPFGDWVADHPDTLVLSTDTGFTDRRYDGGSFTDTAQFVDQGFFGFPIDQEIVDDSRLSSGELVLALNTGESAVAYPLNTLGDAALNTTFAGQEIVLFSSAAGLTGNAFDRRLNGERLTFRVEGGAYRDDQTNSIWTLSGLASGGPLAGSQLSQIPSRTAFWFSIRAAFPEVTVAGLDEADGA
ncbi:MAG TPA: DUF3179 domain-containing protein [Dehalococcoidia bacterium]|nr:DUF3179 domain-containing protein [Dehalococcoidia bacterium]